MKKVYQTIVDQNHGNCEQAAIASLLDLQLEDVPNFIENRQSGVFENTLMGWLRKKGFHPCYINKGKYGVEELKNIAKFDGGFNGYLYASVPSQTFDNCTHAVIVDTDLKIVHDPNPNQKALNLLPEDVLAVVALKDMVIGKTGKLFTKEEWNLITEEERNANTYRVLYDDNGKVIGSE